MPTLNIVDTESAFPAAISIPFATLPLNTFIKGPRYRISFPRFRGLRELRQPAFAIIKPEDKRPGLRLRWLDAGVVSEDDKREYKILQAWWTGKHQLDCELKSKRTTGGKIQ